MFDFIFISIAGLVGGFVGAQVGGSALITIPALIFLGLSPSLAIGTQIFSGFLGNLSATVGYWRRGKLDFKFVAPFSILTFLGAIIGSNLLLNINEDILRIGVVIVFIILVFILFRKPKAGLEIVEPKKSHIYIAYVLSFLIGVYGGLFAAGSTTLLIFMYVLLLGRDFILSAANSALITTVMIIGATVVYILGNNIVYSLAIPIGITSMIGSYIGAHTAVKLGDKWLKGLIIAMVIASVIKLLLEI